MQCVLQPDGGFTVYGAAPDGGWTEHASGRIEAESGPPPPSLDLAAERARLAADPDGPQALFEMLDGRGIALGPRDRKSVVEGKSVSVRVDLGGRRIIKKKTKKKNP